MPKKPVYVETEMTEETQERQETLLKAIEKLFERGEIWRVTRILNQLHPADAADLVATLPDEQQRRLFEIWEADHSADALLEMEESEQVDLAESLSLAAIAHILDEMPADDAVDLLGDLPAPRREDILRVMEPERAEDIRELLTHREDTAGGLMTPEYVAVRKDMTAQEAIEHLREIGPAAAEIYYVFVTDEQGRLVGVVSLRDLIVAQPSTLVKNIMDPEVYHAHLGTDQEEVARRMRKYDLLAIPVVDEQGRLSGMITADDVMDVMEDEATEDMYRLAGAGEGDVLADRLTVAVRSRMPWVAIALLGETLVVGSIAGQFQFLIVQLAPLLVFWPPLTNLGGNIAVQAATIIVRGLATGQLDPKTVLLRIAREIRLGVAMGLIAGLGMGVVAALMGQSSLLGGIVALAAISIVLGGALVGTFVPILSQRMGADPAVTSPLLTVAMDASATLLYFVIALAAVSLYPPS